MTATTQTKLKKYKVVFLVNTEREENSIYDELLSSLDKTALGAIAYAHDVVEYD
mgnify:CR=1 FL=1